MQNSLKRSMPCADLISMGSNAKDRFGSREMSFETKSDRSRTSAKRLRLDPLYVFDVGCGPSPATAALEEALNMADDFHLELENMLSSKSPFHHASCATDFALGEFMTHKNCKNKRIFSPVHEVSDVTHVMARMTTSA